MRHHLSYALRTMSGLVNRRVLDEAADELDRLNNLIIETVAQSSDRRNEYQRQLELRDNQIRELERTIQKASQPPIKDSPA
jgi:hypothetical protein